MLRTYSRFHEQIVQYFLQKLEEIIKNCEQSVIAINQQITLFMSRKVSTKIDKSIYPYVIGYLENSMTKINVIARSIQRHRNVAEFVRPVLFPFFRKDSIIIHCQQYLGKLSINSVLPLKKVMLI